jgi:hypothetical protein
MYRFADETGGTVVRYTNSDKIMEITAASTRERKRKIMEK